MSPVFLLSGILMIGSGLGFIYYWRYKTHVPWGFFGLGILGWIIAVFLKGIAALSLPPLKKFLYASLTTGVADPILWIYTGLLTGIFECLVVYVLIKNRSMIVKSGWNEAVGFGIGFGSIEAILLGITSLTSVLLILYAPEVLPEGTLESMIVEPFFQNSWSVLIPVIERISTIFIHTFAGVLIIMSIRTKRPGFLWCSFGYKTIVDTIAAVLHITLEPEQFTAMLMWSVEIVFVLLAIAGIYGLIRLKKEFPEFEEENQPE